MAINAADLDVNVNVLICVVLGIPILLAAVLSGYCCQKRKHKRNEQKDCQLDLVIVDKQKEQHHLLTEETDGEHESGTRSTQHRYCENEASSPKSSREDTELEERQKVEEKLKREEEEGRQKVEEKLKREEEEGRQKVDEKLKREEEEGRQKVEEKLKREEEEGRQKVEEKLKREEEEGRQKVDEKLKREEEEGRQKVKKKLKREEEEEGRQKVKKKLKREEEQKPKGHTGLRNQGATCYLNSVLQALFMTEDFRNTVERLFKPIDVHIAQLFIDLKSPKGSVATTERITSELKINVHEQQDAAEYFQNIMNMVNSEMSKVYQGEFEHRTMCKNPGKEHPLVTRHESFYVIPICMETQGMDSPIKMQSYFDSYFEPIKTCEDDRVKCPTCKELVNTEITCNIHKLPPVLVVQLERFQLDYNNYKKNTSAVEIQFQLSVKDDSGVQHKYDLYAVVKHTGSFHGGHYYAVIKSFEDHQWYEFNDSSVRKTTVLKNPFQCKEAFLLLYKKHSHESAVNSQQM